MFWWSLLFSENERDIFLPHPACGPKSGNALKENKMEKDKKMYSKVDTAMNFVEREKEIANFWKENNVFEDSIKEREGGE